MNTVIIVAAGKGKRMKSAINKQYLEINKKPILAITLEKFQNSNIDDIILVLNEKEVEYCKENVLGKYNFSKVKFIINGGKTRQESVYNGLKSVSKETLNILIHDGARPFITKEMINKAILMLDKYPAMVFGVPVKDTIKISNQDMYIDNTPERNKLWSIQTPQIFKYNLILRAYDNAYKENIEGTDDSSLVEKIGERVKIIEGSYNNIKITTPEDVKFAKILYED